MLIEIHEKAKENLNKKSEALFGLLKFIESEPGVEKGTFVPERFTHHIKAEDIISTSLFCLQDFENNIVTRFFYDKEKRTIGLKEDDYNIFQIFCRELYKIKNINSYISIETVEDIVAEWLREKYLGKTDLPVMEYSLNRFNKLIDNFTVWIPITGLYIEEEFNIGDIYLKIMSKNIIGDITNDIKNNVSADKYIEIDRYIQNIEKEYLGLTFATYTTNAEYKRAIELAFEKSITSIGLLRVFSPVNLSPKLYSLCDISNRINPIINKCFLFKNNKMNEDIATADKNIDSEWKICKKDIESLRKIGLDNISNLLDKINPSIFEEIIIDSLLLYSRNTIAKNISDKIIHIFSALETLLLKDEQEPLIQNISERVAFCIGNGLQERKDIVKNIKYVYGLRSKSIHHGLNIEHTKELNNFMKNCFYFFIFIIDNMNKYKDKNDLINKIEDKKLS